MRRNSHFFVSILLVLLLYQCVTAEVGMPIDEPVDSAQNKSMTTASTYTYHEPIDVVGDVAFEDIANTEMWPGNGSASNPYIIQALNFTGNAHLLRIRNVSFSIHIIECWFESLIQDQGIGIYLEDCASIEIVHSNFTGLAEGVRIHKTNTTRLDANRFTECNIGTKLSESSNSTFSNNLLNRASFEMFNSSFGNITSNEFLDCGITIRGQDTQQYIHHIENNVVNNKPFGYFASVSDMTIDASSYGQVYLVNASRSKVENGAFNKTAYGIHVAHSTECSVKNVNYTNMENGIILDHVANSTLRNVSVVSNTATGIWIEGSSNCTIHASQIVNNTVSGIHITDSFAIIVNITKILHNGHGVFSSNSASVFLANCTIENNTQDGIHFINTIIAVALNNSIAHNHGVGIYHGVGGFFAFFTYNYLGWNGQGNAYDAGFNSQWDDAKSLGNYWSDYTVPPTYTIPGPANSVDRYPRAIIDLTAPIIMFEYGFKTVNSSVPVPVIVNITDVSPIIQAILSYRINESSWTNISMEQSRYTECMWFAMIPPASNGSVVEFKVYAEDSHGNWGVSATESYGIEDPPQSTTTDTAENDVTDPGIDQQLDWMMILAGSSVALLIIAVLAVMVFRSKR